MKNSMAVPMIKSRFSIASIVRIVIHYRCCFCFGHKNKGKEVELMITLHSLPISLTVRDLCLYSVNILFSLFRKSKKFCLT